MRRVFLLLLIARPLFAIDFNDPRALVADALEKHPALTRLRAEAAAARELVAPAEALPNPMIMSGVQNKQVDLRDDTMMTMYMVGASQRLVRPEKREARREAAELAVRAAEQQLVAARAAIERDVLLAWYEVAATDAQLASAVQVREMLEAVVAAARVRYEVGNALQAEVIRAQLQGSDLEHEMLRLRGARRAALARLLPLLDLPLATDVPQLRMPEGTEDRSPSPPPDGGEGGRRPDEGAPLAGGTTPHPALRATLSPRAGRGETLDTNPPEDHPALLAVQANVAMAEAEIRLADLDRRPDIDLEAQYGYRRLERDVFSLTARIELPLRAKQTVEPRVREAMLRRDAAKARVAELRRDITRALAEAVVAHEDATNQMRFHHEVLVPQAQLAFESTLAAYETGRTSFESILETQTDYLRLRLQYYEFLGRHAQAVVRYEALRKGATE
jgi:outer membrane protein, heavy metal efflux system